MGNKITAVSDDQMNGFKYENGGDLSDCYIVDLENFSNGVDKQHSANSSRITVSSLFYHEFLNSCIFNAYN